MLSREDYIRMSLEADLFFLRVMKEHSLFLKASFTPKNLVLGETAGYYIRQFEGLLQEAVQLSDGVLPEKALRASQFHTEYTADAEKATQYYTGILIDTSITTRESNLEPVASQAALAGLEGSVSDLNQRAMSAVTALISFKSKLFSDVVSCRLFMNMYPSMIHHILREAAYYSGILLKLQNRTEVPPEREFPEKESFWNAILAEHARFTGGMLDPSETQSKERTRALAAEMDALAAEAARARENPAMLPQSKESSLAGAARARDFAAASVAGLLSCRVKSVILPLLADHILRETNHYIYVLSSKGGL